MSDNSGSFPFFAIGFSLRYSTASFSSTLTTIPELANGLFRFEGDQPFTTSSPLLVDAGAIIPPGHMQKEKTPRSFICSTNPYDAGDKFASRVDEWYWIRSIKFWGCSIRTPRANGFASIRIFFLEKR